MWSDARKTSASTSSSAMSTRTRSSFASSRGQLTAASLTPAGVARAPAPPVDSARPKPGFARWQVRRNRGATRLDVLVEPEEVLRVVLVLQRDEACVLLVAVRRSHALIPGVGAERHRHAGQLERLDHRPPRLNPGELGLGLLRRLPLADAVARPRRLPGGDGVRVIRNARDLAAERLEEHDRVRRSRSLARTVRDGEVDQLVRKLLRELGFPVVVESR